MKILTLTTIVIILVMGFMLYAQEVKNDPTAPNKMPHASGQVLAMNFAHADHVEQSCIDCHHNFVDTTGLGMCIDCHKTDTSVAPLLEEQFHELCRSCHVSEQQKGSEHGPTRQCNACHTPDDQP